MSNSVTPSRSLSPYSINPELATSFSYHHDFSNSGSKSARDHTVQFKKALLHKWKHDQSILCMVASPKRKLLYCGTQNSSIVVLDLITFQKKLEIFTHVGSVLCLHLSECEDLLFSGGSDSLVKVWNIKDVDNSNSYDSSITLIPTHTIYTLIDIGDIFSVVWVGELKTIFFGAQNASLFHIHIDTVTIGSVDDHIKFMPSNRFDKFFDSKGSSPSVGNYFDPQDHSNVKLIQVPHENTINYAHNGYLYAIDYITIDNPITATIGNNAAESYKHIIVSAGGDGDIKLWGYTANEKHPSKGSLTLIKSLCDPQIDSIYSFAIHLDSLTIYAGSSNGKVAVWDLATFQLLKIFYIDDNDVYTMTLSPRVNNTTVQNQWLLMGTEEGITKTKVSTNIYEIENTDDKNSCIRVTKGSPCLTLKTFQSDDECYLASAGSDKTISLWSLETIDKSCIAGNSSNSLNTTSTDLSVVKTRENLLEYLTNEKFQQVLGELISFRSVSKQPDLFMGECRKCANYLTVLLKSFGAYKSQLLPVDNGNPIVHACFKANSPNAKSKDVTRLLWYGHYDVIPASHSTWDTPPFVMTPQDGYLYARGVTDNKGPMLVAIFAIAELHAKGELESDVIFLLEGEEESGSWGFQNVVYNNKDVILDGNDKVDWIMLSNSYWLDDVTPCLNYGLRGKLDIQLEVWSDKGDRHSGVDGGVFNEPSMDLVKVLSSLVMGDEILIPGFKLVYSSDRDLKRHLKDWEKPLYDEISRRVDNVDINELIRKWSLPSLTLHKIEMSGPDNGTVISQKAEAELSIRIVPTQDLEVVKESFVTYVNECFSKLKTNNFIKVQIMHEAEPWLGNVNNTAYQILKECLREEWGVDPIFVREGGSIPSIRFLEKTFNASAIHIPTGQSSDNAHLNNERVRIINLLKSKEIIKKAANRLQKDKPLR